MTLRRDELLNETPFFGLDHARTVIAAWVADQNTAGPHPALGYQAPAAYAAQLPQRAIGSTKRKRSADRPLLALRKRAIVTPPLWFQLNERRGSERPHGVRGPRYASLSCCPRNRQQANRLSIWRNRGRTLGRVLYAPADELMRVALRTDASLQIGTGHVMRGLALARGLRAAGALCRFICRELPGHAADRIRAEGFEAVLLPAPTGPVPTSPPAHAAWAGVDWARDAAETRAALGDPPDWLVVDHYAFDARWEKSARLPDTRLMVIDDLADRDHACDLLLDQNLGRIRAEYDRRVPDHARRLIGPSYALLRPEFALARAASLAGRSGRGLGRILVTMGGVDQADATSAVLEALRTATMPEGLQLCVVMGARAPALGRVQSLARQMPWRTEVFVDVANMAALMSDADLAVSAGGTTTWERCCLGLPSVIVQVAENQAGILRAMIAARAALDPGPLQAPSFAAALRKVVAQASRELEALSQAAAALCDGAGTGRVIRQMLTMVAKDKPD